MTKRITPPIFLFMMLSWFSATAAEPATRPLDSRLIEMSTSSTLKAEDEQQLIQLSKAPEASAYVATALLFKHWPSKYGADFKKAFGFDSSIKTIILPDEEINERVNARIKELQGRHPLDISSQLYLTFRRSGYTAKQANGNELPLEKIFRGAVFTGIVNGRSLDEVNRLSAIADGKTLKP